MASLQARHSRGCRHNWTAADLPADCTCPKGPTFYVDLGIVDGRHVQERVGRNKKLAQQALRRVQVAVDEESYQAPRNMTFSAWADEWKASLRRPKDNTLRSYDATLDYAKAAFGPTLVRKVGPADVRRFLELMPKASPSTQRKHLRVLGACFRLAVRRGYATRSPVDALDASELPVKINRESAYFESDELTRLLAEVPEGLHLILTKTAIATGLRQAELVALKWGDVDLSAGLIRVRRIYTPGLGLQEPKSKHSKRDVYLPDSLVGLLGSWWGECGKPADDALVFPGQGCDRQLVDSTIRRVLYDALDRAGIPRVHPATGETRTFHSLRHSYAELTLENGRSLIWLSRQLGHSDVSITSRIYAHVEDRVRALDAKELVIPGL
jgi:integrase